MIVIPPIDCTAPGVVIANNAVDEAAWAADATYAADAVVRVDKTIYTSLQAGNIGKAPATEPLWWVESGPSNKWAMFDNAVATATTKATGGLSFTLAPGRFTALGFMGLVGNSITITIRDGATVIQTKTRTLATSAGTYYGYCFNPFNRTEETVFTGLLSAIGCTVQVDIAAEGVAACGLVVVGTQFEIGQAQYGFSVPIEDRGRHYLDALGNPVNLERGYAKGVSGTIVTDTNAFNNLTRFFAKNIGIPMLWVATPDNNDYVAATVFGRYIKATPVIAYPTQITVSLEIAGYR